MSTTTADARSTSGHPDPSDSAPEGQPSSPPPQEPPGYSPAKAPVPAILTIGEMAAAVRFVARERPGAVETLLWAIGCSPQLVEICRQHEPAAHAYADIAGIDHAAGRGSCQLTARKPYMAFRRYAESLDDEIGTIRAHLRKVVKDSGVTRREIIQRTDLTYTVLANILRDGGSGFSFSRVLLVLEAINFPPDRFFADLYELSLDDLKRQLEQLETRVHSLTTVLIHQGVVSKQQIRAVAEQDGEGVEGS